MRLLIMGPPGAGKGTQAVDLAQRVSGAHVSTGEIFRAHVGAGTALGRTAQGFIEAGEFVPDEVTNAMVADRFRQPDAVEAFVLDGYPRTVDQLHFLDAVLSEQDSQLDGVVELVVDSEELVARLLKRGRLGSRSDDTPETIRRRLAIHAAETQPPLVIYRERNLVASVDGIGTVAQVSQRIAQTLSRLGSAEAQVNAQPLE
ncbi:MAG: adenylate kinase [Nocardioides sp.]|uniref:adenylate kinase n=1 Tax=Nocardioides sp. TaxID=35761 RepID=UPI0039E42935